MGELGAFLKIHRSASPTATRASASRDFSEFLVRAHRRGAAPPGRALHGVRRAVLPQRLPAGQPDPGLERPRLPRPLGATRSASCTRRTTSPSSPAGCARRRARRPACSRSARATRSRSSRSRTRSSTAPGTRAGSCRSRRATRPAAASPSSAPGPAGMAAAQQLRRAGHRVVLFERDEAAGGLVRFGVPDFKIEKRVVERRVEQLRRRGRRAALRRRRRRRRHRRRAARRSSTPSCWRSARACRATCPCPAASSTACTSRWTTSTCATAASRASRAARGAGGRSPRPASTSSSSAAATPARTASATRSARARASVTQLELLPEPPEHRPDDRTPWPLWPQKYRLSYAMEEAQARRPRRAGLLRDHDALRGRRGRPRRARSSSPRPTPRRRSRPVEGTERELQADLVLLAMGFLHPEHEGVVDQLGVDLDARGNVKAGDLRDVRPGVFAAGDARRGPVAHRLGDQRGPPGARGWSTATSTSSTGAATTREPVLAGNVSTRTRAPRARRRTPTAPSRPATA